MERDIEQRSLLIALLLVLLADPDDLTEDLTQLQAYCDREEGGCVSMEPHVPSFDDVFVRLVSDARKTEKRDHADGDTHRHA